MEKYLTQEAYDKLKKELKYLETVKRKEVAEQIRHAVSFGDLSENAAYDDAKDAKSFLEGKIIEIRDLLESAKIVSGNKETGAQIGSRVTVECESEKMIFYIVDSTGADVLKGKISCESPIGQALMRKKEGDSVGVETPSGAVKYKIIKIE